MSDEPEDPQELPPGEQLDKLTSAGAEELTPKERFRKTSNIALLMAYDLIDKLRYWERETLQLPDDQIEVRLDHLVKSVERLRSAYLDFSDLEL